MAEKYFVSGLLLLSLFGSLILLLNRGLDSTTTIAFVAVLVALAIISFIFMGDQRKSYSLMVIFFLASLLFCAFTFADNGYGVVLWVVTVSSLVGFAISISGPMMAKKGKAVEKKASAHKPAKKKAAGRRKKSRK
jgi:hypothetical protein